MGNISATKFSSLIRRMLLLYGSNGQPCSHRTLAFAINPKSPPNNAIGQWLNRQRVPYGQYIDRIASMLGMTKQELECYLADDDSKVAKEFAGTIDYTEHDLSYCLEILHLLQEEKDISQMDMEDVQVIVKNLDVKKLYRLKQSVDTAIRKRIEDPRLLLLNQIRVKTDAQIIRKLSLLAEVPLDDRGRRRSKQVSDSLKNDPAETISG